MLKYVAILTLPAFIFSCSADHGIPENQGQYITKASVGDGRDIRSLDIWFFNDDRLAALDSYQRIEDYKGGELQLASCGGAKILAVIANMDKREDYILSYRELQDLMSELACDDPSAAIMSAGKRLEAGGRTELQMEPLLSSVVLRSISCDFSGRLYAGQKLEDVKVYLTNVCCRYPLFADSPAPASAFVNLSGYSEADAGEFSAVTLYAGIGQAIGNKTIRPGIELFCYPNNYPADDSGSPATKLVIEGKIAGRTYYYPLNINLPEGISRNCSYCFDVSIRRKGSASPDLPVSFEDVSIKMEIIPWEEKDNERIYF